MQLAGFGFPDPPGATGTSFLLQNEHILIKSGGRTELFGSERG